MLDPVGRCLTRSVATRIAQLRGGIKLQQRLDELAERNPEGLLTAKEQAEYGAYVEALDVLSILQAKARRAIKAASRGK